MLTILLSEFTARLVVPDNNKSLSDTRPLAAGQLIRQFSGKAETMSEDIKGPDFTIKDHRSSLKSEDEVKADEAAHETYYRFLGTQARTAGDLLLKMEAWAEFDWSDRRGAEDRDVDLDGLAALGDGPAAGVAALRDLRRLAGECSS